MFSNPVSSGETSEFVSTLQTLFLHILVTSPLFVMLEVHSKIRLFLSRPYCALPAASMC